MLKYEYINFKINSRNKTKFVNLGYDCKIGDIIKEHISLLGKGSKQIVTAICDFCKNDFSIGYDQYNRQIKCTSKCACKDCMKHKISETSKERFANMTEEEKALWLRKRKETHLERYGVDNPMKSKEIQDKYKNNLVKAYGVENQFQREEVKEKSKKTINDKYGVEHIMHLDSVKKIVFEKGNATKSQHGSQTCSSQQKYLHDLIGGALNYLVDNCWLDIAFPNDKIYIEYNGSGHDIDVKLNRISQKEFKANEMKRYFYLKSLGWKQIVIESRHDLLPQDDDILKIIKIAIEYLNKGNHHYIIKIDSDGFNNLRKIKTSTNKVKDNSNKFTRNDYTLTS